MASKDFNLDDFDFDDFNFNEEDIPGTSQVNGKDRKPISEIGQNFLSGVKETFTSEAFLRRTASEALPRGYGKAINTTYEAVGTAKDLYNSAVDELKPAVDSLRYLTGKIIPSIKKVLPKGLEKKLDDFAKDANNPNNFQLPSQQEVDEKSIKSSIEEIFKVQTAAQQEANEFSEARQEIRDQIDDKKFKMGFSTQQRTRMGIDRLVAYQDQVTSQYQKKSLELQYRQFFAMRDIAEVTRRDGQTTLEYLKSITFNTSLPDIQKTKFKEVRQSLFEERLAGGINNAVTGYIASFIPKLKERIVTQGRGLVGGLANGLSSTRSALEMADDFGMSSAGLAGNAGGSMLGEELGYRGASWLRGKTEQHAGLRKFGNMLEDKFGSIPERLNRYGRTPTNRTGVMGFLESIFKTMIPTYSPNLMAGASPLASLDQPAVFNNLARRSLTEIIPGYLARILREVTAQRTGDPNVPLLTWSVDRGQFVTTKSAASDVMHRLYHPAHVKAFRETNSQLVNQLDPNSKLTPAQRKLVARQVAMDGSMGLGLDPSMWMQDGFRIVGASKSDHDAIIKHLRDHYKIDPNGTKVNPKDEETYNRYRNDQATFERMRSVMPDPNEAIRVYGEAGQMDLLRKLGLVTKNGFNDVINSDKNFSYLLDGDIGEHDGSGGGSSPPGAKRPGPSGGAGPYRGRGGGKPGPSGGGGGPRYLENSKRGRAFANKLTDHQANQILAAGPANEDPFDRLSRDIDHTYKQATDRLDAMLDRSTKLQENVAAKLERYAPKATDVHGLGYEEMAERGGVATAKRAQGSTRTISERLIDAIQEQGRTIIDQLATGTLATESKQQTTDLDEVVHLLKTRNFLVGGTGIDGDAHFDDEHNPRDTPEMRLAKRLMRLRRGAANLGHKAMDKAGSLYKWGKGRATAGWGLLNRGWQAAGSKLRDWGDSALDMAEDLYERGKSSPILEYAKLKAGEYYDEAGKVIHKWSDIKGAVYDSAGRVVCDAKQAARGFYDRRGKRILSNISSAVSRAIATVAGLWQPTRWLKSMRDLGRNAMNRVRDFVDQAVDIYVRGEDKPRMRAVIMEAGGYFSARTGKPVMRPSQIDGEVKNERGDTVISLEDFDKGLVNVFGFPVGSLKTIARRLVVGAYKRATAAVSRVYKATKALGQKGWDIAKNSFKSARDWATGKFHFGIGGVETHKEMKRQTTILERIYKLLDDRLPGKKVLGDNNGDGVRDGSYLDEIKREKDHDAEFGHGPDGEGGPGGAGIGGLFGWLKSKFGKKSKDDSKDDDDDDSIVKDMGEDWLERKLGKKAGRWWRKGKLLGKKGFGKLGKYAKKIPGVGKLVGKLGKFKGLGGKLMGLGSKAWTALKAARWLGAAGSVAEGAGLAGAAGTGLATTAAAGTGLATTGGLAAAGTFAAGTGAEVLGAGLAAEAGGGILAGLAGLLSAPVLLAAGAVALAGYGAYKLYKHFKNKIGPLEKVRMAQYGIPLTQPDKYNAVRRFEALLLPHVKYGKDVATVDMSHVEMKDVLGCFDIDPVDTQRVRLFGTWFLRRFKPVFLSHLTALHKLDAKVSLTDVDGDGLKMQDKMTLLQSINVPESTYTLGASPFSQKESLNTSSQDVDNAIAEAKEELQKNGAKENKNLAAKQAAFQAAAKAAELHTGAKMAIASQRHVGAGGPNSPISLAAMRAATMGGAHETIKSNPLLPTGPMDKSGLSALTAIRLKAYGASEMTGMTARALMAVERMVIQNLDIRPGSATTFKGEPNHFFNELGQLFAITSNDEVRKKEWLDWFTLRFVPVTIQYINTAKAANPSADPLNAEAQLTAMQRQMVGQAIVSTTTTVNNTKVSIWDVKSSPFQDRSINTDAHTTDGNMTLLNEAADKQKLVDPTGKGYDKAKDKVDAAKTAKSNVVPFTPKGGLAKSPGYVPSMRTPGSAMTMGSAGAGGFHGGAVAAMGPSVPLSAGTGGNIAGMPNATGKGWAAMKDVILQAAQMTGVDPATLATFANIESSFDPNAKAPTSSAEGLFQFIDKTWKAKVRKYGAQYGITMQTPRTDPRASAIMGALYIKENAQILQRATGHAPTMAELYMAHFLGPTGAARMLTAPEDTTVDKVVSASALRANRSLMFGRGGRPLTVAAFVQEMQAKIASKGGWNTGPGADLKIGGAGHEFQRTTPLMALGKGAMGLPGQAANDPSMAPGVVLKHPRDFNEKRQKLNLPPSGPMLDHLDARAKGGPAVPSYVPSQGTAGIQAPTVMPMRADNDQRMDRVRRTQRVEQVMSEVNSRRSSDERNAQTAAMTDLLSKQLQVQVSMDKSLKQITTQLDKLTQLTGKQIDTMTASSKAAQDATNPIQQAAKPTTSVPKMPVSVSRKVS